MAPRPATVLLLSLILLTPLSAPGAEYNRRPAPEAPPDAGAESTSAGLGLAYVTYLSGEALFRGTDAEEWGALTPNLSLRVGDRLWAGDDGRIEIRLPGPATAWLSYRSELDLVRFERGRRGDTIQVALASGEGSFDVARSRNPDSVFQVDLPGASVRAFDEARFRVNTLPDGSAQIGVTRGSVDLEIPDGVTTVTAGRLADLRPDGRVTLDFLPPDDDWDEWVSVRARRYDRPSGSARYLPPEMAPYAPEFDEAGRWVVYPPYGTVWVPSVAAGWSPYSNGRWVWSGGDYVWLSFDPWYAPFHYGRWNFTLSLGWVWIVPRRAYWSPGYVAWSLTDREVCWVPLGHGEVYYGYGSYGPDAVNVRTTVRINVTNVFANSRVRGGVVVVRRDDFLRGRSVRDREAEPRNPFVRGGGRSEILWRPPVRELRPTRETRLPRPEAEVSRRFRPPERVERASDAMRRRPAPAGRDRSVFAPGRRAQPLRDVEREPGVQVGPPADRAPPVAPPAARGPGRERASERGRPAPPPERRRGPEQRPEERGAAEPGRPVDVRTRPPAPQETPGQRGPAGPELRPPSVGTLPPPSQPPVGRRPFRRAPEPEEQEGATTPRFEGPRGRRGDSPREEPPMQPERGRPQEERRRR